MPLVSIIIPIGPHHEQLASAAFASANAQTIPCEVLPIHDHSGQGAGWARNQGAMLAEGSFLVFLDADDWLHPTFVEECLAAWRTGTYVYTDWGWNNDGRIQAAPDCLHWGDDGWHLVTTLLLKKHFLAVDGFDETLPVNEDSELYFHLSTQGICGKRLAKPLVEYGAGGFRSKSLWQTPLFEATLKLIYQRYGGLVMGCCGDDVGNLPPANEPLPGWVLVRAMWDGNRKFTGKVSHRSYPRTGNGKLVWVDPVDLRRMPELVPYTPDEEDDALNEAVARSLANAQTVAAVAKPASAPPIDDPALAAAVERTRQRNAQRHASTTNVPPRNWQAVEPSPAEDEEAEDAPPRAQDVFDDLEADLFGRPPVVTPPPEPTKPPKASKSKPKAAKVEADDDLP